MKTAFQFPKSSFVLAASYFAFAMNGSRFFAWAVGLLIILPTMVHGAGFNGHRAAGSVVHHAAGAFPAHTPTAFECNIPPNDKIAPFAWDRSGEEKGRPYFPLSSAMDQAIELKMLGADAAKCMRMHWSNDNITVLSFFFDPDNAVYFTCKQVDPPLNKWDCIHLKGKGEPLDFSHTAYVTLTDNKSYSFTVRCFPKLKMQGWTVFTTRPTLTNDLRRKLLNHAGSLGLPNGPTDLVCRDYSLCKQICLR